jgi:phytoene dehydrogenase-like protein
MRHILFIASILSIILSNFVNAFSLSTAIYPPSPRAATIISASATFNSDTTPISDSYDVVIVGSGIGGLSAAALLCHYGLSVLVCESHYAPGGAAHGYSVYNKDVNGTFHFDTGPSFFSGLNPKLKAKTSNPLRTILDIVGESVDCIPYSTFGLMFPEGEFVHSPGFGRPDGPIDAVSGKDGVRQWKRLMDSMVPLAKAVDAMPTMALRADPAVALTAGMFLPNFAKLNPLENLKLTTPFSSVVNSAGVVDPFVKNWLDVLCFCLSGVPAHGTITAEMAMMMGEFYDDGATMDCPVGGAKSIVDALVRGIEKNGRGRIIVRSHVSEICIEDGRAVGIRLKKDQDNRRMIRARRGVISNLSVWDLMKSGIVKTGMFPPSFVTERENTPACPSFMHLHVGFRMSQEELSQLQAHYICVDDWERGVTDEENCVLLSIPSVHDDSLAPVGYAVLHCYTPATEKYDRWENLKRNTPEYDRLKEERGAFLWKVLEKVIPDIRQRAIHHQIGTPLTHQRFLNRHRGSYGPSIYAGEGSFPFPNTPIKNLLVCGDSCFPGIGIPAVSGSGMMAANSISFSTINGQLGILKKLKAESAR